MILQGSFKICISFPLYSILYNPIHPIPIHTLPLSPSSTLESELIHGKWLNTNKEAAYKKIMKITNRIHIQNLGKYLDIVKNK
jgi:hypothetical protein